MMKTLEELREAVERFQKDKYVGFGVMGACDLRRNDSLTIADCLTDHTPISKEVLEGMAVGLQKRGDADVYFGDFNGLFVEVCFHGDGETEVLVESQTQYGITTVGHLYSLLLRLGDQQSLQGESKGEVSNQ
jgi:hypothetical protein